LPFTNMHTPQQFKNKMPTIDMIKWLKNLSYTVVYPYLVYSCFKNNMAPFPPPVRAQQPTKVRE